MHQPTRTAHVVTIGLIALSACAGPATQTSSPSGGAAGQVESSATTMPSSGGGAKSTGEMGQSNVGGASITEQTAGGAKQTTRSAGSGGSNGNSGLASSGSATSRSAASGGASVGGSASSLSAVSGGSIGIGGGTTGGKTTSSIIVTGGNTASSATSTSSAGGGCGSTASLNYDQTVLCDRPVAYWAMTNTSGTEPDLTARANHGSYRGGPLTTTTLPNGDPAVVFDGATQYLTMASNAAYSIPTTGEFTWEAWINPSELEFPNDGGSGYVDWMGKCADYSPTCEWEARMYRTTNSEGRCNRISAYVFNPSAGLGSAADWQPTCGLIQADEWYHVVGAYTTKSQPTTCANSAAYPGSIDIWVNGVKWNQARHNPTGCMSQYSVIPKANASPVNIGTMAGDGWFPGAIAKVAFFDYLLSQAQVTNHYTKMTGKQPTGSCVNDCRF